MRFGLVLLATSCLLSVVSAQCWSGPYQLSGPSGGVNGSACKEFLPGGLTCVVWQSLTTEAWNIASRFGQLYNGNGWYDIQWVTRDSAVDHMNPAVACLNDWHDGPSFWCVWERRESHLVGSIMGSYITFRDSWSPPVVISRTIHTDGDSAMPSIITIKGASADTVWVAWRDHDTGGTYISYVYNDGDSWSEPGIAAFGDIHHARLGRMYGEYPPAVPLLVWERSGGIFYSTYREGAWTAPAEVAFSPWADWNPDVVSDGGYWGLGTYVVWESMRGRDTAVYIARGDTFAIGERVCDITGAGTNVAPAGANVAFTTQDDWACIVAWVSDRNGNPDIYTSLGAPGDAWVDLDSADDLAPVVTCMGNGMGAQMAWVLWQSNRNGNWDIYGSFVYNSAVEETPSARRRATNAGPTILSGSKVRSLESKVIFDALGRRVLNPTSGVYFVAEGLGARGQGLGRTRKVILGR